MTPSDPDTDPDHDLRRYPQDPDARQPGERLVVFWDRVGAMRRTPRQPIDPPWYTPDGLAGEPPHDERDDEHE